MGTRYTIIQHEIRDRFKLTLNEYAVADLIFFLSNNPTGNGWCHASREKMGEYLALTKKGVLGIVDRLIAKQLIERDPETKYLRATPLWYDNAYTYQKKQPLVPNSTNGNQKLPDAEPSSLESVLAPMVTKGYRHGNQRLPNNNIYNKTLLTNVSNVSTARSGNRNKVVSSQVLVSNSVLEELLVYWNNLFGSSYKSIDSLRNNVSYWLRSYSLEEIKAAIERIPQHSFWKDKMNPTLFFRKRNPRGEEVDYIGEMLNIKKEKPTTYAEQMGFKTVEQIKKEGGHLW